MTFFFIVGAVLAGVAVVLHIPQQLGLLPTAESLLADTPDREGAAELTAALKASGVNTTGMSLYLLPMRDGSGVIAYAILDASAGFKLPTGTSSRPGLVEMFVQLAGAKAKALGVTRVAVDYRDSAGTALGLLTAPTSAIARLTSGQDDLATFSKNLDGRVDVSAVMAGMSGQ